jgi:hypothetical protein
VNPKLILAEARCTEVAKIFSETPAEYRAHVMERLQQAELEEADVQLRYRPPHPEYVSVEAKLAFLRAELQRQ